MSSSANRDHTCTVTRDGRLPVPPVRNESTSLLNRTRIHSLAWRKKFIQSRLVRRPRFRYTHRSARMRDVSLLRIIFTYWTRYRRNDTAKWRGNTLYNTLSQCVAPTRNSAARLDVNVIRAGIESCAAQI